VAAVHAIEVADGDHRPSQPFQAGIAIADDGEGVIDVWFVHI
jgi:hypothetical protein